MLEGGQVEDRPYQTTVLRNSFQLSMHRRCAEVMRQVAPEMICPGHRDVLACNKDKLDEYCDFIASKERVFRNLVPEPADHYIDLFWARLLPYVASVAPGEVQEYRLLLRNNQETEVVYEARLRVPQGWSSTDEYQSLRLSPGARGELALRAAAPMKADDSRRLLTAEICIDGVSQGNISEALVQVRPSDG